MWRSKHGVASFESLEMTFLERHMGEDREKGVDMRGKRGTQMSLFRAKPSDHLSQQIPEERKELIL